MRRTTAYRFEVILILSAGSWRLRTFLGAKCVPRRHSKIRTGSAVKQQQRVFARALQYVRLGFQTATRVSERTIEKEEPCNITLVLYSTRTAKKLTHSTVELPTDYQI